MHCQHSCLPIRHRVGIKYAELLFRLGCTKLAWLQSDFAQRRRSEKVAFSRRFMGSYTLAHNLIAISAVNGISRELLNARKASHHTNSVLLPSMCVCAFERVCLCMSLSRCRHRCEYGCRVRSSHRRIDAWRCRLPHPMVLLLCLLTIIRNRTRSIYTDKSRRDMNTRSI